MQGKAVGRANEIVLALYMLLIVISSVFLYVTHKKLILAGLCVVLFAAFFLISHFLLKFVSGFKLAGRSKAVTTKQNIIVFAIGSLVCLIILSVWYAAFRPGFFGEDNNAQLTQAFTGVYYNSHSIWDTLVFYTLPYKLTGSAVSLVPFQMIIFSLCAGYMCMILYRYAGIAFTAAAFAYVMLNPFTGYVLMFPVKDIPFAMSGTVAASMAAAIVFSGGEWAGKWYKCALLGFMLANATLFRYNGILFTGFLLLALLFNMRIRRWIVVAAGFAVTILIVQGPVYHMIDAQMSDTEVVQKVGLPMSVIGNAVKETPDIIDRDIVDFAYSYAPREVWEEHYFRGNFNLIKYGEIQNPEVIEEAGAMKITGMAARCFIQSPQASMDAVFALTDFVYGLDLQDKADIDIMRNSIIPNDYGLEYAGSSALAGMFDKYASVLKFGGKNFFRKLGFGILLVIVVILSRLRWTSAESWKRVLICLPILAYDFGTMLLLSGHDARFFFISFLVCPITIAMGLYETAVRQEDI